MEDGRQLYNSSFLCGKFLPNFTMASIQYRIELKQFMIFQLFSTDSKQNGADHEGIDGFLVEDIIDLAKSYSKTRCCYCKHRRATVRCCEPNCKRTFHVICGVKKKCLFEFVNQFNAFCHLHAKIDEKYDKHTDDWYCRICYEVIGEYDPITSIPSCCNQDYFHKKCMQTYAIMSGCYTRCPSCGNDPDGYRKFLSKRGIFCPEKDAGMCSIRF